MEKLPMTAEGHAMLESELKQRLPDATLVSIGHSSKLSGDTVKFGARVTLIDEDAGQEQVWKIVGEPEADAKSGTISVTSPLARALIGHSKGTSVELAVPSGIKAYKIKKVEWR